MLAGMFGRRSPDAVEPAATTAPAQSGGKRRPTPSRREAEEARKQQLKVPKGNSKEARRARRERDMAERERSRAAMLAGDERYMPARDRGPARRMARDVVDGRFTIAEFFIVIAILVLVMGFIPNPAVQWWVSIGFFALTAAIIVDTAVLLVTLSMRAKREFPEKRDRRGLLLYASMRALQLRRLRLPPPRVRRGGAPITPKAPKAS